MAPQWRNLKVITKRDVFLAIVAMHGSAPRKECNVALEGFQSRIERWAVTAGLVEHTRTLHGRVHYRITQYGLVYLHLKGFRLRESLRRGH